MGKMWDLRGNSFWAGRGKRSRITSRLTAGVVVGLWLFATAGQIAAQTCKVPSFDAPRSLIYIPPLDGFQIGFTGVARGDFNGDGLPDVVAVHSDDIDDKIYIFLNAGGRKFYRPDHVRCRTGSRSWGRCSQ
jgi:hypothetical protein